MKIRRSRKDDNVFLFHRGRSPRWLCAVAKQEDGSCHHWDSEKTSVKLDEAEFSGETLAGLSDFSHVEIFFYMDQVDPTKIEKTARHPRNNPMWPKVGIFSQRGKNRPNQIGATVCRILKVEGPALYVEGLDAVDGTPVLDIKPWVSEFAPRGVVFQPEWITELMKNDWKA